MVNYWAAKYPSSSRMAAVSTVLKSLMMRPFSSKTIRVEMSMVCCRL